MRSTLVARLCVAICMMAGLCHTSLAQTPREVLEVDTTGVGYLHLALPPGLAFLVIDDDFGGARVIGRNDTLAFTPGRHRVTIANEETGDINLNPLIKPGEVLSHRVIYGPIIRRTGEKDRSYLELSSFPVLASGYNLVVETDSESEVFIDGTSYGFGTVRLDTVEGRYAIETQHPRAGMTTRTARVRTSPPRMTVVAMFNKPAKGQARGLSVLPGATQLYERQRVKGAALLGTFLLGAGGGAVQHALVSSGLKRYEDLRAMYEVTVDEQRALELGDLMEKEYDAVLQKAARRNVALGVAAAVYLISFVDAWIPPKYGYREARRPPFELRPSLTSEGAGMGISIPLE